MLEFTIGIRQVSLVNVNRGIHGSPRVSQRMLEEPLVGLAGIEIASQSTMRSSRQPVVTQATGDAQCLHTRYHLLRLPDGNSPVGSAMHNPQGQFAQSSVVGGIRIN